MKIDNLEDYMNTLRFFNTILPTIFVYLLGICGVIGGVILFFYDWSTGVVVLIMGFIFLIIGIIFKDSIPPRFEEKQKRAVLLKKEGKDD